MDEFIMKTSMEDPGRSRRSRSTPRSIQRRSRVTLGFVVTMFASCAFVFLPATIKSMIIGGSGSYVDAFSVPTKFSSHHPHPQTSLSNILQNQQNHHKMQKLTPCPIPQNQQQRLPPNELRLHISSTPEDLPDLSVTRQSDALFRLPSASPTSSSSISSLSTKLRRMRKMMMIMMSTMMSKVFHSSHKLYHRLWTNKLFPKNFLSKSRTWIKRTAVAITLMMVLLLPSDSVWAAGSSGRMGGSMGSSGGRSSSRPSMSRPMTRPSPQIRNYGSRSRPPPIRVIHHHRPHHYYRGSGSYGGGHHSVQQEEKAIVTNPDGTITIVRKQTTTSVPVPVSRAIPTVGLLVGVGVPVAYWLSKQDGDWGFNDDDNGVASPLGPGASAASLTVCLLVPKRGLSSSTSNSAMKPQSTDSTNNNNNKDILTVLEHLAETADTSTRKGLQNIIEETSVELLRQKDSIISVDSQYTHFKNNRNDPTVQAERQYRQWSAIQRGKFERETISNYGGNKKKTTKKKNETENKNAGGDANNKNKISGQSTVALVHITIAMEGNSLKETFGSTSSGGGGESGKRKITTRQDLVKALTQLSSDCQVEDCLLSAEVIWSPEDPDEQLTMDDIYADFPSLYTLL